MADGAGACGAGSLVGSENSWGGALKSAGLTGATASLVTRQPGVISGVVACAREARRLGLEARVRLEGERVNAGDEVARVSGPPDAIARASAALGGMLSKPSGVATSALAFVDSSNGHPRIVSSGWRALPAPLHEPVRLALKSGGASPSLSAKPLVEIEDEHAARLDGIRNAVSLFRQHSGTDVAITLKAGDSERLVADACEAADAGASIIVLRNAAGHYIGRVSTALRSTGLRDNVELALRGDVRLRDISVLKTEDVDIIDVGRAIADAALMEMDLVVSEFEFAS